MKAYVAGPMRGYAHFNFPAFDECATYCRTMLGWEVRSPAEHDRESGFDETADSLVGFDMRAAMRWDIESVLWAEAIVLLPGWQASKGATMELTVARAIGCRVMEFRPQPKSVFDLQPESVLAEADRLVAGPRQESYGPPRQDFERTGRMWGAILGIPDVDPAQVGLCMVALKISREVNRPKRDNLVDMAGYTQTVQLVREDETES